MSNLRTTRWAEVKHATQGFAFSHATEAGEFGLRGEATLKIEDVAVKESRGKDVTDAYMATLEFNALQTDMAMLKNFALICREPRKYRLKNADGEFIHFWENSATIGSPNGSRALGTEGVITITDTAREAKVTAKSKIFDTELAKIITIMGSATDGSTSGGSALGLTATSYDRTEYVRSNIIDVKINSVSIGIFNSPSITIKFVGQADQFGRVFCRMAEVSCSVNALERSAVEYQEWLDASLNDYTIEFLTANDETFRFTSSLSSKPSIEGSDKDGGTKIEFNGSIPMGSINWGDATPGVALFPLV